MGSQLTPPSPPNKSRYSTPDFFFVLVQKNECNSTVTFANKYNVCLWHMLYLVLMYYLIKGLVLGLEPRALKGYPGVRQPIFFGVYRATCGRRWGICRGTSKSGQYLLVCLSFRPNLLQERINDGRVKEVVNLEKAWSWRIQEFQATVNVILHDNSNTWLA